MKPPWPVLGSVGDARSTESRRDAEVEGTKRDLRSGILKCNDPPCHKCQIPLSPPTFCKGSDFLPRNSPSAPPRRVGNRLGRPFPTTGEFVSRPRLAFFGHFSRHSLEMPDQHGAFART